jgi:hypothetical protein
MGGVLVMSEQTKMGTIRPSKRTASIAWRNAIKVVRLLRLDETAAAAELKAVRQALEQARAVAEAAEADLFAIVEDEEPVLPGMGRVTEPE